MRFPTVRLSILAIAGLFVCASAQTDAQRVTRFSTLLGSGKYAKMVWQKTTSAKDGPDAYDLTSNQIKYMDSKDGVVKTLKTGGTFHYPRFSLDGKYILYVDKNNNNLRIMDSSLTNDRILVAKITDLGNPWKSADGTQYVVASRLQTNGTITVYRINVTTPSDSVVICRNTDAGNYWEAQDGIACQWAGLSADGNYLAAGFPIYGYLGIYDLKNKLLKYSSPADNHNTNTFLPNGCWITMSYDAPNQVAYTNNDVNAHSSFRISNMDQSLVKHVAVIPRLPNMIEGDVFDLMRWTVDRDYITFGLLTPTSNGKIYNNHPNPWLFRCSDGKSATVYDNLTGGGEANMDVFFYPPATSVSTPRPTAAAKPVAALSLSARSMFDIRGRLIVSGGRPDAAGVYLVKAQSLGSAVLSRAVAK